MAGDWKVLHNLKEMSDRFGSVITHFPRLMDNILGTMALYMVRETRKRFTKQMSPDGTPWPPLSGVTKKARKQGKGRAGRGSKALLSSGMGRQSITPRWDRRGPEVWQAEVGPDATAPYLKYHQTGFKSRITGKQAWWMIINLYGYDPQNPGDWLRQEVKGKRYTKKTEGARRGFGQADPWMGWYMAQKLWEKLVGRYLRVPARPFAGINKENEEWMGNAAAKIVQKFMNNSFGTGVAGGGRKTPGGGPFTSYESILPT